MSAERSIVVGVDGSECGWSALSTAARLAGGLDARLAVCFVHHHSAVVELAPEAAIADRQIDAELDDLVAARLREVSVECELFLRGPGRPADELMDLAEELGAEMIVVGTHGRGLPKRALLGSIAHDLVSHSTTPVLVVR